MEVLRGDELQIYRIRAPRGESVVAWRGGEISRREAARGAFRASFGSVFVSDANEMAQNAWITDDGYQRGADAVRWSCSLQGARLEIVVSTNTGLRAQGVISP